MKYNYVDRIMDFINKCNGDTKKNIFDVESMDFIKLAITSINDSHFPELEKFNVRNEQIFINPINNEIISIKSEDKTGYSIKIDIEKDKVTLYSSHYGLRVSMTRIPNINKTFNVHMSFVYDNDIICLDRVFDKKADYGECFNYNIDVRVYTDANGYGNVEKEDDEPKTIIPDFKYNHNSATFFTIPFNYYSILVNTNSLDLLRMFGIKFDYHKKYIELDALYGNEKEKRR